jgi:hypothetical protein
VAEPEPSSDRTAALTAAAASAAMVAFQLAGKATRDALFLSTFGVAALPRMVIVAGLVSALVTIALSRMMARVGPGRLVPPLFALSALLLLAEWGLAGARRPLAAVVFYLHFGALGALLVSGFWAVVTERFDPRSARRTIGRITAGASAGAILGGILPDRMAGLLPVTAMFPLLAVLHLISAALVLRLCPATPQRGGAGPGAAGAEPSLSARQAFVASPYLRALALLVALTAMAEGLLDWVFKARATSAGPSGEQLLSLFALFYTVTALLGIVIQAAALRPALVRIGTARTAALLPAGVSLGALGGLLIPGLLPLMVGRGIELVLRQSVFRGAYELLFTPVTPREKHATKLLVDVGAARLGDVAGGALIQVTILLAAATAGTLLLGVTIVVSLAALIVARWLHRGYGAALARSLTLRADQIAMTDTMESSALLQTVGGFDLGALRSLAAEAPVPGARAATPAARVQGSRPGRLEAMGSGDARTVREALVDGPLTPPLVERAIGLLAWDEVAPAAIQALGEVARGEIATLVRHLLDQDEEFAVRRRLVRVVGEVPMLEAVEALLGALGDRRFEVRFRAGRGLSHRLSETPGLEVDRERVIAAVLVEVTVERSLWESRRLLDEADDGWDPLEAEVVRNRAGRSLEHVFTLLALILPREPLRLAYHALHTDDRQLRGTALEYLESVLPAPVRERLWRFLEPDGRSRADQDGTPDQLLERLLMSHESIMLAVKMLRRAEQ